MDMIWNVEVTMNKHDLEYNQLMSGMCVFVMYMYRYTLSD